MEEKELLNKLKYLLKKKRTLQDISLELGLKEYEVFGLVEVLRQEGYFIDYRDDIFIFRKEPIMVDRDIYKIEAGDTKKTLLISDTHLGSKYDRIDILRYLYELAEEEQIDTVFHVGD